MGLSRRGLLAGVGGVAVVGAGAAVDHGHPGIRRRVRDLIDPPPKIGLPTDAAGPKVSGHFRSAAMGGSALGWTLAYPPGHAIGARLPLCVALHGRGADHTQPFATLGADRYLGRVVEQGAPPFAVASVDGGDHSYWHKRATGEDPQRMLAEEFLPLLAAKGLKSQRIGLIGWSMGGFGALLIAETWGSTRVAAAAASSPALWHTASETPEGAFDDADDFLRNDVFTRRSRLAKIPVRLACGDSDPFLAATKDFAKRVSLLSGTDFHVGGHTDAFWRDTMPGQLAFVGHSLS